MVLRRLIYDCLCSSSNLNIEEFEITKSVRLHCKLANERYKQELEKNKQKSALGNRELKRKQKLEEVENLIRQQLSLSKAITDLTTAHESELLKAYDHQDLTPLAKAASFLRSAKEKESELKKITDSQKILQQELKQI